MADSKPRVATLGHDGMMHEGEGPDAARDPTPLELAVHDLQVKTAAVATAKTNIGTVRKRAAEKAKESINAAKADLDAAKTALEESRKAFDRTIRAAQKP